MTGKRKATIAAWVCALIAVWALAAACGDGGGDSTGDGIERTTCKPAQPVVVTTPTDLPQEIAEYQSPERGYRVRYPSDWLTHPNQVAVQNIGGDAFISPVEGEQIRPNMAASCETVPVGTTSEQFLESKLEIIEQFEGQRPEDVRNLTVDGKEAFAVEYALKRERTPEPLEVEKIEVFFADDLGGWTLALAVPKGTLETYRPIFDAFVESYRGP